MGGKKILIFGFAMLFIVSNLQTVSFAQGSEGHIVNVVHQIDGDEMKIDSNLNESKLSSSRVIIGFYNENIMIKSNDLIKKYGGKIIDKNELLNSVVIKIENDDIQSYIEKVTSESYVRYAEPDKIIYSSYTPNDIFYELEQWGPQRIKANDAWDITTGDENIVIAVIDTGVDYTHPDIFNNMWRNPGEIPNNDYDDDGNGYKDDYYGIDFIPPFPWSYDGDPMDDNGHGTHCAGIAAAGIDNNIGIAGISKAQIMAVKVFDSEGEFGWWGFSSDATDGITYVIEQKLDDPSKKYIISMSFICGSSQELEDAVQLAWDNGILMVACSGNQNEPQVKFPAAYEQVIAVGAINQNNERCDESDWGINRGSNYGVNLELMAPGNLIYSTLPGTYDYDSGTSQATPHVAGAAALIWANNPQLTTQQLRAVLKNTAEDLGSSGWDQYYGYGLINTYDAIIESDSILKGLEYLRESQNPDGSWSNNVGITALCTLAFLNYGFDESWDFISDAINYLLSPDNMHWFQASLLGIYNPGQISRATYMSSMALLALKATYNPDYEDEIEAIKDFLVWLQWDDNSFYGSVDQNNWYWGGFGYGSNSRPDLSNTQWALMALAAAGIPDNDPLWQKALVFVERCQSPDGGFIYTPLGSLSSAGSYGSMTGAGIWSYKLCGLSNTDSRIIDALNWFKNYYTWDENPNMRPDGRRFQYYYYVTISKALAMMGQTHIVIGGTSHDWYQEMSEKIISLQHQDGYWVNTYTAHGSEEIADLATAFAILALEIGELPPEELWMSIILASSADLHVYDPQGRHTGKVYDENGDWTGEIEIEIPGSTYEIVDGKQIVNLSQLVAGSYRIELIGTSTGDYDLTIIGTQNGNEVYNETFEGSIVEGEVQATDAIVTAMEGALTIISSPPTPAPVMEVEPKEMTIYTSYGDTILETFQISSLFNDSHGVTIYATDMIDDEGNVIDGSTFSFTPNGFTIPMNDSVYVEVSGTIPIIDGGWTYTGSFIIESSNAGSKSIAVTLIMDHTAPVTNKTIGYPKYGEDGAWVTSTTEFNLSATDDISGVDKTYYRTWHNDVWILPPGTGTGMDNNFIEYTGNFTISGEGRHYIEYYSVDNAGNIEEVHIQTHYVDDTPPTVQITKPERGYVYRYNKKVGHTYVRTSIYGWISVEADANDDGSGLSKVEFYVDDILKQTVSENPYRWIWNEQIYGYHMLKVVAFDNLDNNAFDEMKVWIFIRKPAPFTGLYIFEPNGISNFETQIFDIDPSNSDSIEPNVAEESTNNEEQYNNLNTESKGSCSYLTESEIAEDSEIWAILFDKDFEMERSFSLNEVFTDDPVFYGTSFSGPFDILPEKKKVESETNNEENKDAVEYETNKVPFTYQSLEEHWIQEILKLPNTDWVFDRKVVDLIDSGMFNSGFNHWKC